MSSVSCNYAKRYDVGRDITNRPVWTHTTRISFISLCLIGPNGMDEPAGQADRIPEGDDVAIFILTNIDSTADRQRSTKRLPRYYFYFDCDSNVLRRFIVYVRAIKFIYLQTRSVLIRFYCANLIGC